MLKIKDGVDLKELEKFGFKPIYDKDTGKIKEYIMKYEDNKTYAKLSKYLDYRFDNNYEKKRWFGLMLFNIYRYKDSWCLDFGRYLGCSFDKWQINLLYDLIEADLVEKVGE